MPISIHGWVEVTRHDEPERSGEHAWMGALNLGALIDVVDPISERLFGFRRSPSAAHSEIQAVAAGRGLPAYPSQEVEAEITKIRSLAYRTGQDECGGYTHASWREIQAAGLSDAELRVSDWATVFDVVRTLERDERIGPDRIRLVIYYCVSPRRARYGCEPPTKPLRLTADHEPPQLKRDALGSPNIR